MITEKDKSILRGLAEKIANISRLSIHSNTINNWKSINGLRKTKPMVWINEIPWHEMDVNGELKLQTTDKLCQEVEQSMRQTIYQWEHMRADMVVENKYYSPLVIHDSGYGISEVSDVVKQDENNDVVSRHFIPQIKEEKDVEKIIAPVVTHDEAASENNYQTLKDIFGDILPVEKCGIVHKWVAPWDELICWWGVQEVLMDMIMRPDMVHQAMERLINAHLSRLDQWEKLNLLSYNEGNYRVGSGALGYTDELPQKDFNPAKVRSIDQWGCSTAQIFSDVSPEMHEEFALQYERRWLKNFGLNYYGCCEPLHNKIDIIKSIPNLRKISISPWANVDEAVKKIEDKYVISYKPNPSVFAEQNWNPELARKNLVEVLEKTKGCVVEITMKDISTLQYQPQHLWEWAKMASEVTEKYA